METPRMFEPGVVSSRFDRVNVSCTGTVLPTSDQYHLIAVSLLILGTRDRLPNGLNWQFAGYYAGRPLSSFFRVRVDIVYASLSTFLDLQ